MIKQLKGIFYFVPNVLTFFWLTRAENSQEIKTLRLLALLMVICTWMLVLQAAAWSTWFRGNENRILAARLALNQYPALAAIETNFEHCFGSPYWVFKSDMLWVECDLAAIDQAVDAGLEYQYLSFVRIRNQAMAMANVALYPTFRDPPSK